MTRTLPNPERLIALATSSARAQLSCITLHPGIDREGLAGAIGRGVATVLSVGEDEPLSDRQRLIAQYDSVLLGDCTVSFWEYRRPGALAALYAWAADNGATVREISGDPVCYEATIPGVYHTICVFVTQGRVA